VCFTDNTALSSGPNAWYACPNIMEPSPRGECAQKNFVFRSIVVRRQSNQHTDTPTLGQTAFQDATHTNQGALYLSYGDPGPRGWTTRHQIQLKGACTLMIIALHTRPVSLLFPSGMCVEHMFIHCKPARTPCPLTWDTLNVFSRPRRNARKSQGSGNEGG
jgi:hypothetical protein